MEKKIKALYEQYCEIPAMIQAQRMNFLSLFSKYFLFLIYPWLEFF